MKKIIARGAEAVITLNNKEIIKNRIAKSYRYPDLDEKIRKLRTRAEAKMLEKAAIYIPVPKIIKIDELKKELKLEYIPGKKLADSLDRLKNKKAVAKQIGQTVAKLHAAGLVHGDLTTSNLILYKSKIYIIDFGLGFHSSKIEDCAVDLQVLKEALEAKHPSCAKIVWKTIIQGYKRTEKSVKTLKQLEKVEKRGRYKEQY